MAALASPNEERMFYDFWSDTLVILLNFIPFLGV